MNKTFSMVIYFYFYKSHQSFSFVYFTSNIITRSSVYIHNIIIFLPSSWVNPIFFSLFFFFLYLHISFSLFLSLWIFSFSHSWITTNVNKLYNLLELWVTFGAIHKLHHMNFMIFLPLPHPCHRWSEFWDLAPNVTSYILQFYI